MTTQKASFIQDADNSNQVQGEGRSQEQESTFGFAPSHEHTSAYLYGLLSPEESTILEQRVEENPSFSEALQDARRERALFDYWTDVPPPSNLLEKTLLRIQQVQDESDSSNSSSV